MTERLALFGLIGEATATFDGEVADAVAAFCAQYGMEPARYASTELLEALDDAVQVLDGTTYLLDDQLQLALSVCQLAAKQPQRYTALPDGSWTAVQN